MSERREYNPDEDPQQRLEQIRNAFEQQEYERAVQEFSEAVRRLSRNEGRQDAALELAQEIEAYRLQVQDSHPELLNTLDTKIAEAYLYASDNENENVAGAEERYSRIAATELVDVPQNGELSKTERGKYSEVFHALDRLGDVAFVDGRYKEASERYADAIQKRAEFMNDPNEQGPLACATYGAAASHFLQGDIGQARSLIGETAKYLDGKDMDEKELIEHTQALSNAIDEFEGTDPNKHERILEKLNDAIRQKGGSEGGVKHIDFSELVSVAIREAEENEE